MTTAPAPSADQNASELAAANAATEAAAAAAAAEDEQEDADLFAELAQFAEGEPDREGDGSEPTGPAPKPKTRTQRSRVAPDPRQKAAGGEEGDEPAGGPDARFASLRSEMRAAKTGLEAADRRAAVAEDRLQRILGSFTKYLRAQEERETAPPPEPPPSYAEDPERFIEETVDRAVEKGVRPIADRLSEEELAAQEADREAAIEETREYVRADREATIAANPQFLDAEAFVMERTYEQLAMNNPGASHEQLVDYMQREYIPEIQLRHAMEGRSLHAHIWDLAQRWGYQPPEEDGGNGTPPPAKRRRDPTVEGIRERLARQPAGVVPPAGARKPADVKDVLKLSDDDFADLMDEMDHGNFEALLRPLASPLESM